ncbi:GvpL/GvpF family gas vesicle protein [Bradyrhizobium oligotrophicum]|nr:GvpL/GvpF family gas vesicle protein [Bradyrhizobium oligotrophicum]
MNLVGITTPDVAGAIAAAGGRLADVETRAVEAGGLVALLALSKAPFWHVLRRSRTALRSMLTAQRILEAAAVYGPLLPARPGTLIRNDAEACMLLRSQCRHLAEGLRLHGTSRQYQITISWDPVAALAARRDHQDLVEAAAASADGAADKAASMIQRFMSDQQARFEAEAMRALAAVAEDVITLPVNQPDMLMNAVVLLAPGAEPELERVLEALDRGLRGKNLIRLIGPLPPVSFAAVSIERPGRQRIAAARRLLGIGEATRTCDLRRAYLDKAHAHHPDTGGHAADASIVGAAAEAFRLLARVAEARASAGQDDVILVDIRRQDQQRSLST